MNEAETRRRIIDERLRLAGWKIADPSQVVTELDLFLTTQGGRSAEYHPGYDTHQFADYGLLLNAKPGLVLETKRTSKRRRGRTGTGTLVRSTRTDSL